MIDSSLSRQVLHRDMAAVEKMFLTNVDLQPLNTFGLPARAALFTEIVTPEDVTRLLAEPYFSHQTRLILGGGSNMILSGDFPGLVLKVAIRGRRLVQEDAESWIVEAGAGENWHAFVQWTLAQGYGGLENLSLIPGSVGAAPVQNIGAYGLEMAERFDSLDAIALDTGEMRTFEREACEFGYRESIFKRFAGRWLILRVRFRLMKAWQPVLHYTELANRLQARHCDAPGAKDIALIVMEIRQQKLPDPAQLGNAGSFFKNPVIDAAQFGRLAAAYPALPHYPQPDGAVKLAAGWLVDQSGWRGRSLGAVGCFERQALVLVNHGGARGGDVHRIAAAIQHDVYARFGVSLETEPVFV